MGASTPTRSWRPDMPMPRAGLAHLGVGPGHADVGVGEHRRDGQGDEHDERRERPDEREGSGRLADAEDLHHEDQRRERWQRPSDVRDVDGDDAAFPHVADQEADRQRDQRRDGDRHDRDLDVLARAVDHAVVPGPVGPVAEPVPDVPEEPTPSSFSSAACPRRHQPLRADQQQVGDDRQHDRQDDPDHERRAEVASGSRRS